jgi:hypothetical protein
MIKKGKENFMNAITKLLIFNVLFILNTYSQWEKPVAISGNAHSGEGTNDYHLEIYSSDTGDPNTYIGLRFHQSMRYWHLLKVNSSGFLFWDLVSGSKANIYAGLGHFSGSGNNYFGGYVGIGTTTPDQKLTVAGTIKARELIVEENAGSDFVFAEDYDLMLLEELEQSIKQNKHLPEIPSSEEMKEKGVAVAEMQMKLLQKIEELTLYVIDLKKENNVLKERVASLEEK